VADGTGSSEDNEPDDRFLGGRRTAVWMFTHGLSFANPEAKPTDLHLNLLRLLKRLGGAPRYNQLIAFSKMPLRPYLDLCRNKPPCLAAWPPVPWNRPCPWSDQPFA
jgi:hypothetical protein